ncbi:hypothetical protein QQX98_011535 [Neonectria punicea]|uniref:Uncharacterized protein n=1 Tax=Neonectria punicea TaxID=979145 RepID=A0ABR1GLP5_9HYPO
MEASTNASLANIAFDYEITRAAAPYLSALELILLGFFLFRDKGTKLPYLNPKNPFEWSDKRAVSEFIYSSKRMLYEVAEPLLGKPYRVLRDLGDIIILPPDIGEEIRNDKRFSFVEGLVEDFQGHYSGFDAYKEACHPSESLQNVVKLRLTKTLAKLGEPLSEECDIITRESFTDNKEWHDVVLKEGILAIVARMSSRIFVGKELGRDPKWLSTIMGYAELSIQAMQPLRLWPEVLRPLVVWFTRDPAKLRAYIKDANAIIFEEMDKRQKETRARQLPDAIEWFQEIAKGQKYHPGLSQLILATVAIHTTADLIAQAMYDIIGNQELIDDLRKEIITAIGEGGWKKTSLHNLKLMDSVLKESQRLKPNQIVGMHRRAMEDIELSDGTKIARGSATAVSAEKMWDPTVYPNPNEFDGYRYYRARESGGDATNQLVSTSTSHLGFGHGMHSCPGRFFASNEAKVVLCHFLLKYDFKMATGEQPKIAQFGFTYEADSEVKVSIRRRQEEIDLSIKVAGN